ncbi:interleukin-13 receptor subunit alpha-1 [Megalops cyprinoides]|uniref:interleukin-13 receptor subunit alpha-1 n=1 Tax=Megalops cyprinoides TaxID=118141 RepID=UPI001864EAAB|nr:interleukin-13 receptor subunit alpha-1 [Megalops cyprinoides]
MDLLFQGFFLVTCYWVTLASTAEQAGVLPPPSRVSLQWVNDFCVNLSWSPPENLNRSACGVKYLVEETIRGGESNKFTKVCTNYTTCLELDGGVTYTVRTQPDTCGQINSSEGITLSIPPVKEKLVKDFQCVYYASGSMNCTWNPTSEATDLQLHYWWNDGERIHLPPEPCSLYLYSGNLKTGCHLHGGFLDVTALYPMFFLIKGMRGGSVLRNTFYTLPRENVKPSPPKLKIEPLPDKPNHLMLTWEEPSGFHPELKYWDYQFRITNCEKKQPKSAHQDTYVEVPYDQRCQFRAQVRAVCNYMCGKGASDWSQEESYGQDSSDWSFHVAFIAIPIILTICVIVLLLFLKKLQVLILPQIPDPRKFLKELINSNEDQGVARPNLPWDSTLDERKVFVPEQTEVCLKIELEAESQPKEKPKAEP